MPEGWRFEQSDHSMWSNLVDGNGFKRGSMFYKAAFYDRSAHLGLNTRLTTTEDLKAAKADGTLRCSAIARIPGKDDEDGCVIHTITHPEKFPDRYHTANEAERRRYFEASDKIREDISKWLLENYPDARSPHAYWDTQFSPSEASAPAPS